MTVYIIAAGSGSRMAPYNEIRPKCLLPVLNRPIIDWTIDSLPTGLSIKVVTDRFETDIRQVVGTRAEVINVGATNGSADALRTVYDDAEAVVIPGDVLIHRDDLGRLLAADDPNAVQLLLSPIPAGERRDWVGASLRGSTVTKLLGHARDESTHRIAAVRLPKGFGEWLERTPSHFPGVEVGMMPPHERQIESAVELWRRSGASVAGVVAERETFDLDKPWHILAANESLLAAEADALAENELAEEATIDPSADIRGYVRLGRGSRIGKNVIVRGTVIAGEEVTIDAGAIINGTVAIGDRSEVSNACFLEHGSVVGRDCVVSHAAELSGMIFDGVYLYHYMEIYGIVGTNTDIGAATVCGSLRFDDGETVHRIKSRRELPSSHSNATFIGDYCRTGVNAILLPGHRIGPYSIVGPGVILDRDVPPRSGVRVQQQLSEFSWGPERYGW